MKMLNKFNDIKGFLDFSEGEYLYKLTKEFCINNFAVEIGTYCGKSSLFIGAACKENNTYLLTIDHHMGSEEQQVGQEYFDISTFNKKLNRVNTLPLFIENIQKFNLSDVVKPLICDSETAQIFIKDNIDMLFIDGGHSFEIANKDYNLWKNKIRKNGILAIHDVYDSELEGGQAPRQIYQQSLTENFKEIGRVKSLVALMKLA